MEVKSILKLASSAYVAMSDNPTSGLKAELQNPCMLVQPVDTGGSTVFLAEENYNLSYGAFWK